MSEAIGVSVPTAVERAATASRDLRRARTRRLSLAFAIWVGSPTALAAVYYGWLATPQYESVAVLTLDAGQPSEAALAKAAKTGPLAAELGAVRAHVLSGSTVTKLAREQRLLEHWRDGKVDWWSRLGRGARAEAIHEYYLGKVSADLDASGATLTLAVRAFSAKKARDLARAIVSKADRFVGTLSERSRQSLTKAADAKLAAARERFLRARAAAGEQPSDEARLAVDFARDQMQSAMRSAEMAELEVARRHHYLVVVAEPSLPGASRYPRRGWSVATVFFGALVLMGLVWLLAAMVREHAQL